MNSARPEPPSGFSACWVSYTEVLGRAGQIADGPAAIHGAIERCERTEERWALAELLRIRGELLLLEGAPAAAAADHFRQALDWACRQGALSWKLRAATSLARLLRDHGRSADASALLQPVYIDLPKASTRPTSGPQSPSRRPNRERRPAGKLD
jgi:predicted ATPase